MPWRDLMFELNRLGPELIGTPPPPPSDRVRELKERLLDAGRLREGIEAIWADPAIATDPAGSFILGCALLKDGRRPDAIYAFQRAFASNPLIWQMTDGMDAEVKVAALEALSIFTPRLAEIVGECALLGSCSAPLSPVQEDTIRVLLDSHRRRWEQGQTPRPRHADVFNELIAEAPQIELSKVKVLLVCAQFMHPGGRPSDIWDIWTGSLAAAGVAFDTFDCAEFCYPAPDLPDEQIRRRMAELETKIRRGNYDIVAFESNYRITERTMQLDFWPKLKAEKGFFLLGMTSDPSSTHINLVGDWADICDCVLAPDIVHENYWVTRHKENVIYCFHPIGEAAFSRTAERDIEYGFFGNRVSFNGRGRNLHCYAAEACGVASRAVSHDRHTEGQTYEVYADFLSRTKLLFGNGWTAVNESFWPSGRPKFVITGRSFEAIAAGVLLMDEIGDTMSDFFVPFIHYIPVRNIHQSTAFAQYFLKHDDERLRIAEGGREFYMQHYGAARFWHGMAARARRLRPPPPRKPSLLSRLMFWRRD